MAAADCMERSLRPRQQSGWWLSLAACSGGQEGYLRPAGLGQRLSLWWGLGPSTCRREGAAWLEVPAASLGGMRW